MSIIGGIQTPCIAVCRLDYAAGICIGCKRTLQEVANWLHYTDDERQRIIDELPARVLNETEIN
ncbi:MAG: DUF1289 domain-containing protein [Gammaproteobacteria bacterium]